MKVMHIVGARPNFMKAAPVIREMNRHQCFKQSLVHTGQHYDTGLSRIFFEELELPHPDIHLEIGGGSHGEQTGRMIIELEKVFQTENPDLVMVVGDVNSTLAASLAAAKLGIRIAHVEAGLRSFDPAMPEEINRRVTDALSTLLFTTEQSGTDNLLREGASEDQIFFVGNVMIDTLLRFSEQAQRSRIIERLQLNHGGYAVLTLHRPSNVDQPAHLAMIFETLSKVAEKIPVVFPCHPRTAKALQQLSLPSGVFHNGDTRPSGILLHEPLGYIDFLRLMSQAKFVLTDSGGIQEETTILGIPCLTLRENTERPVTVSEGTNTLVGTSEEQILAEVSHILAGNGKKGRKPPLWDGQAASRIVSIIETIAVR
jgi:UDP-N-acetylglucosamine 2-epimerase (non-hydrolysing)